MPSLYEALAPGWPALPAVVRRLHQPGTARGSFDVDRGPGLLARCVAALFGLPPAGRAVVVELEVSERDGVQSWARRIGGVALLSTQYRGGPARLFERLGTVECDIDVTAADGALTFATRGARLVFGPVRIPLPRPLAPRIHARAVAAGDDVSVAVEIGSPMTGRLLRYAGLVRPQGTAS